MTQDPEDRAELSPEAKKAVEEYRRTLANRSGGEADKSPSESNESRLLRDKPPHWG